MSRYSDQARILYTSYPARISRGLSDCSVVKLGEKKWRVIPNGKNIRSRPQGWIVEATTFPPDTSDFGKICFINEELVENRQIKCQCPDATATDIFTGRDWTWSKAGLFYPCKHIVAVLASENIDFIEDTLKNYNKDRNNFCGEQPSPPDTIGKIISWRSYWGYRQYKPSDYRISSGEERFDISNLVTTPFDDVSFSFTSFDGGTIYRDGRPPKLPYSQSGTGVAVSRGDAFYTYDPGSAGIEPEISPGSLYLYDARYPRSQLDIFAASPSPYTISGDLATRELIASDPSNLYQNDVTIIDNFAFVPLP